ncbi:hypothetical protein DM01DRAFT_1336837 [Hesseltinella vesiculosa]|uniref:RlpA-like protein double-psi beta-barrel domain-containing protein n=1 Tax=Hesseltinella vesiculosa TaxID=101127 RepID=A0A1X2GFF0_9FUNG|nr:hypothetical protein DM01DRAFT_1336837 [Hesseltinella vesiculosa]
MSTKHLAEESTIQEMSSVYTSPSSIPYADHATAPLPSLPQDDPFNSIHEAKSSLHDIVPSTIWTRFVDKYRFGRLILIAGGIAFEFLVMFVVLGSLGVFQNAEYRSLLGMPSVGSSQNPGNSWGTSSPGNFNMGGEGDGTYYDPGVGLTSCGGQFTAQDMIVALNHIDYGRYADPNQSPACGACIVVTGPLGSAKATIQDMCPGCGRGSVDMSPAVFGKVGNFVDGRIAIKWQSC